MAHEYRFFATAPRGVEPLLAGELTRLELNGVEPGRGGVAFSGGMEAGYRACLWSRTAVRVLLPLGHFPIPDAEALYQGTTALPWEEHLSADGTLAVDFAGSSKAIVNSHFGALRVKDGVVDRLRQLYGRRPGVDREKPDVRINAYLHREQLTLAVDLSGEPLHRRGYRQGTVAAPLKENLAAALLLKAGWPEIAAEGGTLLDPLCGSGTLLVEAGWLALDIAPGLLREHWGFSGWLGHVPRL
ncbi:MAG: THUMP domain-containing protein, partial [Candidatus Competibacteraceae bacterium]|nr:THUMP domain-containing protein [Candidatus Competibacteraceae bacterium]